MNLTKKEKFSFGFGALGKDAICCFVGNFLMFYFTDVLFLAPAFVGTLFFVARIWDAINDPMMGLVVDNAHNRFGKFRTWLLVGTLLNAVVFFAMFNTFGLHGKALYIYVSIAYILYGMTYTIMDVPYWSWLPNLTNDPHERESVSVIPRFFASLAGFSIGVFGLGMINGMDKIFGNGDRTAGFRMVALVISILFVFTISVTIVNVKEKAAEHTSFKQIINILFKNKQLIAYIGLLLAYNLCMQIVIRIIMIVIPMVFAVISYLIYEKAYKLKGDYLNNMVKELNVVHEA